MSAIYTKNEFESLRLMWEEKSFKTFNAFLVYEELIGI